MLARLLGVFLLLGLAVPAGAGAAGLVFFGGWYDSAIGSVGFDGSNPNPTLIENDDTIPMAMTVADDYLYWQSNSAPVRIGRSRLDGTEVLPRFIESGVGGAEAEGLSVSGSSLYWTQSSSLGAYSKTLIHRANLDGSNVETRVRSLSPAADGPVIVSNGFAYFLFENSAPSGIPKSSVARARLDGEGRATKLVSRRPLDPSTLTLRGRYLYWVEYDRDLIYLARASVDGSRINTRYRKIPRRGCHVRSELVGAAIGGSYLFIGCESGRIDRISIEGRVHLRELVTHARLGSGPVLAATP